eukprot:3717196-Amphidinium_carterae.1
MKVVCLAPDHGLTQFVRVGPPTTKQSTTSLSMIEELEEASALRTTWIQTRRSLVWISDAIMHEKDSIQNESHKAIHICHVLASFRNENLSTVLATLRGRILTVRKYLAMTPGLAKIE